MHIDMLKRGMLGTLIFASIIFVFSLGIGSAETLRVSTGEVGVTGFKIRPTARMGIPVRGAITVQPGSIEFDEESGNIEGQLVLDIMTFDTGDPGRDANIRIGAFLVDKFSTWTITLLRLNNYDPASEDPMQAVELTVRIEAMGLTEERTIKIRVATSDAMVMILSDGPHYMHSGESALAKLVVSGIERVCQVFHQLPNISMTLDGNPVAGFATADFAMIDISLTLVRAEP